jgi:tetratricopeptide (TPR) repeat protein
VRRAGDQIRVTGQLIDATTGAHLWADTYDRAMEDIFALQDEITETIVASLYPAMQQAEMERVLRQEPQNLAAWDLFVQASWHFKQWSKEDNRAARMLCERAISLDTHFALAFAGLAAVHWQGITMGTTDSQAQSIGELDRAARRAVALDPQEPYAHFAMHLSHHRGGRPKDMIRSLERAIELNPSLAVAYAALGYTLAVTGRPDEGAAMLEKAMRLSPHDHALEMNACLGMWAAHFTAGRYEDSLKWIDRAVGLQPVAPAAAQPYASLAATYAQLNRQDAARRTLNEALQIDPELTVASFTQTSYPHAASAFLEPLRDGLRKAGLKE